METALDGNAAAGLLGGVFAFDITSAIVVCDGCGTTGAVGRLDTYGMPMGVVIRCPGCDAVLLRATQTPAGFFLDVRGVRVMRFETVR